MRSIFFLLVITTGLAIGQIPESLVQERTLVVMDLPKVKSDNYMVRGNWEKDADEIQSNLRLIGIDAIAYLHFDDWNASLSNQQAYRLFFATRAVKNMLVISAEDKIYSISVIDFQSMEKKAEVSGGSLSQAIYRLGNDIKRSGIEIQNFLASEKAEVFVDIPFSKWNASLTYPSRIKRMKVGVARFDSESKNQELISILEDYPYEYELFEYVDDEDAFRKGYQYILLSMNTSGQSIHKLLNYKSEIQETAFISTVRGDSTNTMLKTIPADANVTKFYMRQTVNHEVFVGKDWDADTSWHQSLANFILNLKIALK